MNKRTIVPIVSCWQTHPGILAAKAGVQELIFNECSLKCSGINVQKRLNVLNVTRVFSNLSKILYFPLESVCHCHQSPQHCRTRIPDYCDTLNGPECIAAPRPLLSGTSAHVYCRLLARYANCSVWCSNILSFFNATRNHFSVSWLPSKTRPLSVFTDGKF